MSPTKIEYTIEELVRRHPQIDLGMLNTLLAASGWEDKIVKETVLLFKQKYPDKANVKQQEQKVTMSQKVPESVIVSSPRNEEGVKNSFVPKNEVTFIESDGRQEGKITVIGSNVPYVRPEKASNGGFFSALGILLGSIFGGGVSTGNSGTVLTNNEKPKDIVINNVNVEVESKHNKLDIKHKSEVIPEQVEIVAPEIAKDIVVINQVEQLPKVEVAAHVDQVSSDISFETAPVPLVPVVVEVPQIQEQPSSQKEDIVQVPEVAQVVDTPVSAPEVVVTTPVSLVNTQEVKISDRQIKLELPENLPLMPFEGSPHVWSLSDYKNIFHRDKKTEEELDKNSSKVVQVAQQAIENEQVKKEGGTSDPNEEIVIERTPLNKSDESLVFLAGVMLFFIILILGYMYSNGRL